LDHFRTSLQTKQHDPYSVLLRRNKLPMQLIDDAVNPNLRKVRFGWLRANPISRI
jgi:nuclear GTP-binding protein